MPKYRSKFFYRRKKYSHSEPFLLLVSLIILGSTVTVFPLQRFTLIIFVVSFILAVILLVTIFLHYRNQQKKYSALRFSRIDTMSGVEFEKYVQYLLKNQRFAKVHLTSVDNDFGVDVLAEKYAVQVKRYKNLVGVEAIYQVVGGAKYYNCQKTMVVTNSFFTNQAKELAEKTETILIDRKELGNWIPN